MHNVRAREGEEQLSEVTDLGQLAVAEMWQKIQNLKTAGLLGANWERGISLRFAGALSVAIRISIGPPAAGRHRARKSAEGECALRNRSKLTSKKRRLARRRSVNGDANALLPERQADQRE